jgi:hypothetical protein
MAIGQTQRWSVAANIDCLRTTIREVLVLLLAV